MAVVPADARLVTSSVRVFEPLASRAVAGASVLAGCLPDRIEQRPQLCARVLDAVYGDRTKRQRVAIEGRPGCGGAPSCERELELVDTAQDSRLSRIFFNRTIKRYRAFEGFYGMEDTIERIVGYFKHAAQGLEEKRQILYLLGPVGGGKSSLAERLKDLMELHPIYVLKAGDQISIIPAIAGGSVG